MSYEKEVKNVIVKALEAKDDVEAKEISLDGFIFEAVNNGKSKNLHSTGKDIEISISQEENDEKVLKSIIIYDGVQDLDGFAKFSGEYLKQVL